MISLSVQDLATRLARRRKIAAAHEPTEPPKYSCPICDEQMSVHGASSVDWLGLKDARVHNLCCSTCGMKADRVFHPVVGYYPNIVI